ncbi:hypothetical protein V2I01_00080 [Micromonospora sp. BRA006-A]|nr:hypothetical protein [Micromonospora sp. BRA006-A]
MPGFDEYLLGFKDRSLMLDPAHAAAVVPGNNGVFRSTVVRGGRGRHLDADDRREGGHGDGAAARAVRRHAARPGRRRRDRVRPLPGLGAAPPW